MATIDEIAPSEPSWFQPFEMINPEIELYLKLVDTRMLDILLSRSQVTIRSKDDRGRVTTEKQVSTLKMAKVYAQEIFLDFKGFDEKPGKKLVNTPENREMLLTRIPDLLTYIGDVVHSTATFHEEAKSGDAERFLESSKPS